MILQEGAKILCDPTPEPVNPPQWFRDMYKPVASVQNLRAQGFTWGKLTDPFSFREIFDAVCCKPSSAPGHDCINKRILRLLCRGSRGYLPTMLCLHLLLNAWYRNGHCPDWCSRGVISLIPKF